MRTIIVAVILFIAASSVAAQECISCATYASAASAGVMNPGAGIDAPAAVPQEKAPPESVLVDVQPVVKKRVMPQYPELARKAGIEGKVFVRFWVDTEGKVRDAKVMKSEHEILNEPALEAARQWVFEPAKKGDRSIPVWLAMPFMFKLADKTGSAQMGGMKEGVLNEALGCITTLLSGKYTEGCKSMVAPESSAIIGGKYMPLIAAIDKWGTPEGLPNERGWQIDFVRAVTDDAKQVTTLVVRNVEKKGGAFRYHTVVCEKARDGWKFHHWHTM